MQAAARWTKRFDRSCGKSLRRRAGEVIPKNLGVLRERCLDIELVRGVRHG